MTIFHVIKYPIRDPIEGNDIMDMPEVIRNKFDEDLSATFGRGAFRYSSKELRGRLIEHLLAYEDPV